MTTGLIHCIPFLFQNFCMRHWLTPSLFRVIVKKSNARPRGYLSLVIHCCMSDVQNSVGVFAYEISYILSGGALNSTRSLLCADFRLTGVRMSLNDC